jgi:uncharacterized membrane protein YfcA
VAVHSPFWLFGKHSCGLTGVGGGIFIVPLLTFLYSFEPVAAVGNHHDHFAGSSANYLK